MSSLKYILKILLIPAVIMICSIAESLPVSSFIIIPSGITGSVYSGNRTVYKIESSDEEFILPGTANQEILSVKSGNDKTEILVSSGDSSAGKETDMSKYLRNTPYLNTDKESIKKTAAKFRNSKDPLKDVSIFVFNHISDKKIGIPLLPAASILTGKSGDCTEHSILTVSILRTLQIPARAVMGIILCEDFAGKQNVFVYHMWAEAYLNGRWELVDSTRPLDIHHNRYIALAYHSLMTETPIEYLRAVSTIQDIKISVVR
jgi:hypothetical protein